MSGKSSEIYSVSVCESVTGGGDRSPMTHLPDVGGLTFQGMATTEGAIDGFGGDELFHAAQHSRSTVGAQSPAALGVGISPQVPICEWRQPARPGLRQDPRKFDGSL